MAYQQGMFVLLKGSFYSDDLFRDMISAMRRMGDKVLISSNRKDHSSALL
jgi:hypothetical protein